MAFCSSCGGNVAPGAAFCAGCGNPVAAGGSPPVAQQQQQSPVASSPPQIYPEMGSGAGAAEGSSYRNVPDALGNLSLPNFGPGYRGGWALRRKEPKKPQTKEVSAVIQAVKRMYREKILPMEAVWKFPEFYSPSLTDTDFEAKPMVMLIGQYSTGKTSFIRFLLERDFPGANIGPEPTTDCWVAVMSGEERIIPGNALVADSSRPFTALQKFGMAFLNRFQSSQCMAPILEKITFIDTPGILSGEKQRIARGYDFTEICEWFAERCDRILLLFDAHKLDISDEFKAAIATLKGHDDKIRCVLNKADMVSQQALIRVYGALMWSLGKVIATPEVLRVYLGSFWDQPLKNKELEVLFNAESADLLADLRSLPRNATVRKVNELIKRSRMLKVHVHILAHLQKQFGMFGKSKTQQKILEGLLEHFKKVQQETNLPMGDFPHLGNFRNKLKDFDISLFPKLEKKQNRKQLLELDTAISQDIPKFMRMIPGNVAVPGEGRSGEEFNPFAVGADNAAVNMQWAVSRPLKSKYDAIFYSVDLKEGKMVGATARDIFFKSRLSTGVLRQIWNLADCDQDGWLDSDEFAVAMCLIDCHQNGLLPEIPENMPSTLVPPGKRDLFDFADE